LARHEKFVEQIVEQIFIKFLKNSEVLFNQDEFSTNYAVDKHTKISVEICTSADMQNGKYQWTDISVGLEFKLEYSK